MSKKAGRPPKLSPAKEVALETARSTKVIAILYLIKYLLFFLPLLFIFNNTCFNSETIDLFISTVVFRYNQAYSIYLKVIKCKEKCSDTFRPDLQKLEIRN